jgi:hypothetical protein
MAAAAKLRPQFESPLNGKPIVPQKNSAMKKLLLIAIACLVSLGVFAQDSTGKMNKMHGKMKDCVMMKDGKMMTVKDGKWMNMTRT